MFRKVKFNYIFVVSDDYFSSLSQICAARCKCKSGEYIKRCPDPRSGHLVIFKG